MKKLTQRALFEVIERRSSEVADLRRGNNTRYTVKDAILIVFSIFFLHSSSFKSHCELLLSDKGRKKRNFFGIQKIPTPNQVRNILDPVDSTPIRDAQDEIVNRMQRSGMLQQFFTDHEFGYLAPCDGTEYFRSKNIFCESCCQIHHRSGEVEYHHQVLLFGLSHPSKDVFLPIAQEFIERQDGIEKEDCELNAGYRLLEQLRKRHPQMKFTFLADDLYCKQPFLERVLYRQMNFIVSCKPGSHKNLYDWIEMARSGGDLNIVKQTIKEGKKRLEETYEYLNNVPLRDGDDAMRVNFVQVTTSDRYSGRIIGQKAFATNVRITETNCPVVVSYGKKKWKVENEGNNALKNLGYNLEHNYGHGRKHLSIIFLSLLMLTFMIHTVLLLAEQDGFATVRKAYSSLRICMESIRSVFRLIGCETWEDLYRLAVEGLDTS